MREAHGIPIDLLIVDDNSRDGSVEIVASRSEPWVEILVRTADRGLSAAVLDGMRRARGEVLVCMDADLSHPPDALPRMLAKLEAGADFVIGSRYVDGGSTADDWGFLRWLNSRVATLLARPLTMWPIRWRASSLSAVRPSNKDTSLLRSATRSASS